ncbi:hypothetical protein CONCODRAFT_10558 [Conidiobolus coronatus NRRL 28638]|uniref:Uncharacterized protein n=1 Tax=Conidiobolus coronatus (strain ATCC 28846 / CBS 209.66 / NRRL 28638) TaxID=796925 RepID=A0A137NXF2_CONC2|nr:hypothetical protein CONCODRAFT_10558 [Conidiobolus coronatus NRRL 28638]|eukprot:KXN67381.1 hypothetical protein CONCODRAFT_10558 [Conidiobolus coronatus NRRL 28638]
MSYCGKSIATSILNYPITSITSAKLLTTIYITSMQVTKLGLINPKLTKSSMNMQAVKAMITHIKEQR